MQADVAVEADVVRLFADCDRELGPLTALVNNAGILETQMRVEAMDAARITRIFATNVVGSFLCAREAVRRMSTRHGGRGGAIVNLSSAAARLGSPGEYVDYAASKGAIDTFTIGLAQEVAQEGIRVNAVRAGFIYTEMHASGGEPDRVDRVKAFVPMRRGGQPEEVAQAILWLLSDEAAFTTGVVRRRDRRPLSGPPARLQRRDHGRAGRSRRGRRRLLRDAGRNQRTREIAQRVLPHPARRRRASTPTAASPAPSRRRAAATLRLPMLRSAQLTPFLTKLRGSVAAASMSGSRSRNARVGGVLVVQRQRGQQRERGALDELARPFAAHWSTLRPGVRRAIEQVEGQRVADRPVVEVARPAIHLRRRDARRIGDERRPASAPRTSRSSTAARRDRGAGRASCRDAGCRATETPKTCGATMA